MSNPVLSKEAAKKLIENVVGQTKYYAHVSITNAQTGTTRFANSEISQNVSITDAAVNLTLYDGKKEAAASTNVLTENGLAELVKSAEGLLAFVPEGEYEAFEMSQEPIDEVPVINSLAKDFGIAERADLIKEGITCVEPGYYAAGALKLTQQAVAIGDSKGAFRYAAFDDVSFNTVITHADGTAGAGEAASYTVSPDIRAQFKKAQQTAKAGHNPVSLDLGAHTVVLSPVAFGDLLFFMSYMLNAKAVDDGMSFAAGKLKQKVFGENLTVRDNPNHLVLRPLLFDMEGNPRRPLSLVEKGVVTSYLYDNKRAKKHGVASTGHSVGGSYGAYPANLLADAGDTPLADIIASTKKGIFINEFHYTNFVNARNLQITGLTRNGAFLIENGELKQPISTVRFTESLLDAFCNITAISRERENVLMMGIGLIPAVRIENFHFTSKP